MRDEKVWSLPKFERLHSGGWGIKFSNSTVTCFRSHRKLSKIKSMATSSVKNNCTHTREAVNQFLLLQKDKFLPIINERICEVISHLWLSWPSTCMFWS